MRLVLIIAAWLMLGAGQANAQNADGTCTTAPCYEYTFGTVTNPNQLQEPWLKSYVAACDRQRAQYDAWNPTAAPMTYTGCTASGGNVTFKAKVGYPYAPTQWVQSMSRRLREPDNKCGELAGQTETRNLTIGWQSGIFDNGAIEFKPDGTKAPKGYYGPLPTDGPTCFDGCTASIASIGKVWLSKEANEKGLYRISGDYGLQFSGAACTPGAADNQASSPTEPSPEPACTTGQVNGKPVCVPDSLGDVNRVAAQGGKNATVGNPTAGTKDATVEKIPEAGNGGNAGGPKGSDDGSIRTPSGIVVKPSGSGSPTGNVPEPGEGEEQAECGAPGQPKCLIDEEGTPSGEGAFGDGEGSVQETEEGFLAQIAAAKELQAPPWTWTFELPTGCAPFTMDAFQLTLNVCEWQPMIHDLMSIMWIMASVFLCVRMVFNTVNKG